MSTRTSRGLVVSSVLIGGALLWVGSKRRRQHTQQRKQSGVPNSYLSVIPGPTRVHNQVLAQYLSDVGSADLDPSFFRLYANTQKQIQTLLHAEKTEVVIMSGEAMVVLWGAMKSVVTRGTRVLCVANGLYGYGFAEMAKGLGAEVRVVGTEWDSVLTEKQLELVKQTAKSFGPSLITAVHCETPSGTINPWLAELGAISRECNALFYVDFVSSAGAVPVKVDEWNIDLGLWGTQKVLSANPDLGIVTVSQRTWEVVKKIGYSGYDALAPWEGAVSKKLFPYTHNWRAVAALSSACQILLGEGEEQVFARHQECRDYTIKRLLTMGLRLYPTDTSTSVALSNV